MNYPLKMFVENLLENQPCNFCAEVANIGHQKSMVFSETNQFVALPTLGCFQVGYSLVITKQHIRSFSGLSISSIQDAEIFVDSIRAQLEVRYGACMVAEHGTGIDEVTAACCDHAHIHLIPIRNNEDRILRDYTKTGGEPYVYKSLSNLRNSSLSSYIMLSFRPKEYYIWKNPVRFHRQFARIMAARALGLEPRYNWRQYPFLDRMIETYSDLRTKHIRSDPENCPK